MSSLNEITIFDSSNGQKPLQTDGVSLVSGLPQKIPVAAEEIALLRAFLDADLRRILGTATPTPSVEAHHSFMPSGPGAPNKRRKSENEATAN